MNVLGLAILLTQSINLGERTPAVGFEAWSERRYFTTRIAWDSADKHAEQRGYAIRGISEGKLGLLRLGSEVTVRNAGWTKTTVWLRTGIQLRNVEVVFRKQMWSSYPGNNLAGLVARGVVGQRMVAIIEAGLHRYNQAGVRYTGFSLDVGGGAQWGER